jgi:hypothetical protein
MAVVGRDRFGEAGEEVAARFGAEDVAPAETSDRAVRDSAGGRGAILLDLQPVGFPFAKHDGVGVLIVK